MTQEPYQHPTLDEITLPEVLHALSDPLRLSILQALTPGCETAWGSLSVSVAPSTLSHHLKVLRNAGLPALTVVGLLAGQLLASSVVIETVFSRDGLGRITASAVTVQDIPVVQGVVVLGAAVFVLVNLAVDLVYPLFDRRIVVGAVRRSFA